MSNQPLPRYVTSALIEVEGGSITVTWGLGEVIPGEIEYFGYGIDYYGVDGNGGKRYGVRFHEQATAHVFEWSSATQANYTSASITHTDERIVVFYPDASIGLEDVGTIQAFSHVNGADIQTGIPVTLMR
ncbi:hypothetical protein [Microbacterium murale]|uniref:Fibronectin type III domain-containing protein n=1 Tax=Microbacterium murale TaxID=1081040 RepID=A0ABU0PE55_9MICO|nr:hypothetical protein [Microbacterium murale]MDQ0645603.1 hypothetical protein [Microbacterium murale]